MIDVVEMAKKMDAMYKLGMDVDFVEFMAIVAMLVEEKCKADGHDAVEAFKNLYETSVLVNDQLGKY